MEDTIIIVRANDCVNGQVDCLQLMRDDQGKMGSKREEKDEQGKLPRMVNGGTAVGDCKA